jgi:hypothetical protein
MFVNCGFFVYRIGCTCGVQAIRVSIRRWSIGRRGPSHLSQGIVLFKRALNIHRGGSGALRGRVRQSVGSSGIKTTTKGFACREIEREVDQCDDSSDDEDEHQLKGFARISRHSMHRNSVHAQVRIDSSFATMHRMPRALVLVKWSSGGALKSR